MASTGPKRIHKPGFLLIETMCAILLLIIAGSIMSFYLAMGQKRVKMAQNRLHALLLACNALDYLRQGQADLIGTNRFTVKVHQKPLLLDWDDGKTDQVWLAQARISWHENALELYTFLVQKAL
jgi:type II secretory pathway pseudopilin PulG